ncbi:MAG: hypothetical protein Q9187_002825 [Circinaria calcarea]
MELSNIKNRLRSLKSSVNGSNVKTFVAEGCLTEIYNIDEVSRALAEPIFNIPSHKLESTARIVLNEAPKIFAILLELHCEQVFVRFVESDVLDSRLPLDEAILRNIIPEAAQRFECLQWEYLAYQFKRGQYHKKLSQKQVLPYLQQENIGGGGYSTVYRVLIPPQHQTFIGDASSKGIELIRKELRSFGQDEKAEAELLFLLGSLKHPNIVELLASYTQNGISNLLFHPAAMDLHEFLLQSDRPVGFMERFTFHQAMHGIADGLSYLHNFRARPATSRTGCEPLMHGYHHDIKPRNILVRGSAFILADFGTSKLKDIDKDTKTMWKNTTFEYGAPECRDPETWVAGTVGRALDIWSLACVFSEIVTYALHGSKGILEFRRQRLKEHLNGGMTQCFHDGENLDSDVGIHLDDLEENSSSDPIRKLLYLIRTMFSTEPISRPKANEVEKTLSHIAVEALLDAAIESVQHMINTIEGATEKNLYTTQLQVEMNRILAWSGALGLKSIYRSHKPHDEQVYAFFPEICGTLNSLFKDLNTEYDFESVEDSHDFVLSKLQHANHELCKRLSRECRISADDTFRIITANMPDLRSLQSIAKLDLVSTQLYDNASTGTATKYMTLVLEKHAKEKVVSHRIEASLLRKDPSTVDLLASPPLWLYSYGYRAGEERKTVVEFMPYWQKQHDTNSEQFEEVIETMFSRVQELVEVLKHKPKPPAFRILDCLGAFHDDQRQNFGIVYGYPSEDTAPVRLKKLLRYRKSYNFYPDLSQKLVLAKTLIACVQSFHTSGWLHKNISSLNILFFQNSISTIAELDLAKPYMVGFDHSRKNGKGEYSQGARYGQDPSSSLAFRQACQEYLHPRYRLGMITDIRDSAFTRSYDYYALGLLLLEIGTWTPLNKIYEKYQTHPPDELREEYIKYCDEHLGRIMGPIFQSITRTCLLYDGGENDDITGQLTFQAEVVDKLNKCVF